MAYEYCTPRHVNHPPFTRFGNATRFDLTLASVYNFRGKRLFGRQIRVYAELQPEGGAVTRTNTYVASGPDPMWNFMVPYPIADVTGGNLVVRLYYERSVGHSSIGEVKIDVSTLFNDWRDSCKCTHTFHMPKGDLNIAYRFA